MRKFFCSIMLLPLLCVNDSFAQEGTAPLIRNQNLANNSNSDSSIEKYTISGKKSSLGTYYSVKLNCAPSDWTEVSITQQPEHGVAKLIDQMVIIQFAKTNPRSSCNGKSIKGKVLEFTPNKDYKGADEITVELINDTGQLNKYNYKITVK